MCDKELNGTWFHQTDNPSGNLTWLASTFDDGCGGDGCEDGDEDEHDTTFAPPNSPMGPPPYLFRGPMSIPALNKTLQDENASPVVSGVLDNTWFSYAGGGGSCAAGGGMTKSDSSKHIAIPKDTPNRIVLESSSVSSASTYPYYHFSHDLTFRDRDQAGSVSSNQFLNESNLEILHNSLMDSTRKRKRTYFLTPEKSRVPNPDRDDDDDNNDDNNTWIVQDSLDPSVLENNNVRSTKNSTILNPMFQMFLKTMPGDNNQHHILNCIKGLLDNNIVASSDLCVADFLRKTAELLINSSKCDEETLFHLVTLFERHLLNETKHLKLVAKYCRKPLGKLAMAGNEELSTRAEKCLILLGKDDDEDDDEDV